MKPRASINSSQRKTLEANFFGTGTLRFARIESLLLHLGCTMREGKGSAVSFHAPESDAFVRFHRPHPSGEAKRYQVEQAREFLEAIGMTPPQKG